MRTLVAIVVALSWAGDPGRSSALALGAPASTVSGVVYDSIGARPLAGALVQVVGVSDAVAGRQYSATSDAAGWYVLRNVPDGRYGVVFYHSVLDSLGFTVATTLTEIRADSTRLDLATPAPRTLATSLCGPRADSTSSGLLLGHVRSAGTERFLDSANVLVEWSDWTSIDRLVKQEIRSVVAPTLENGWFAICGVPSEAALHVSATHGADSSGIVRFFVPADSVRHLTLYVGEPSATVLLSGTARDLIGQPVPNAVATVLDSGKEARTNSRGTFAIDNLPSGTHMLEVTALGFVPHAAIVHLVAGKRSAVDVVLTRLPTELAAVRVVARYDRKLAEFERHRSRGVGGHFITPQDIERSPGMSVGQLVRGLPGVVVRYIPREGYQVRMRRASTYGDRLIEECSPTLYIDGARSGLGMQALETLFRSEDIAAMEVYPRQVQRPIELRELFDTCGAIVLWTKPFDASRKRGY